MSEILKEKSFPRFTGIRRWKVLDDPDPNLVSQISAETTLPLSLTRILIRRGISTVSDIKNFFRPDLSRLSDPFLMKDMSKASERLLKSIADKENMMIYGDYDVDGTSGVSMFYCFLRDLGIKPKIYIPDRFTEGYGVSMRGVQAAADEGLKLLIAVDCGITAVKQVEFANSLGIDVIICDHHQPPDVLPPAYAILDPIQPGCPYPFKYLCGTGVAFKLIQAVCLKLGLDLYLSFLDFAAIATSADMVPVTGENRIIVHYGFKQIADKPRASYSALIKNAGFKPENLNTTSVAFALGPRINAVGRLGDAGRAVELLTCEDSLIAEPLASVLESENINRKKIDTEIYSQAQTAYENYIKDFSSSDDVAIVLHNPEWHPGVLGIIASRMVEKYYRPSIILTTFNGTAKGSARSVTNFNIYEALKICASESSFVLQFGGHYFAAGLEVELRRVDEFRTLFNKVVRNLISSSKEGESILIPELKIDSLLNLYEISPRFVSILKKFEPFGQGNNNPLFLSKNVQVVGEPRLYNNNINVFRVRDYNQAPNDIFFDCIYYRSSETSPDSTAEIVFPIIRGNIYDMVYSIEENFWNDKTRVQLRLRDLRPVDYKPPLFS